MSKVVIALAGVVLVTAGAVAQGVDKLSETEQLRLALHKTQIALEQSLASGAQCRAELRSGQLMSDQQTLKAETEKAHPGYTLDVDSGQLVKKP